jgi:hypothetical protein
MGMLTDSEREWLRDRERLGRRRYELAVAAAADYPTGVRIAGTPLLADPAWLPASPLPLAAVHLDLACDVGPPGCDRAAGGSGGYRVGAPGTSAADLNVATASVRPLRGDGTRYPSYAAAVAALAPPAVFVDRPTYRLSAADLSGRGGRLVFGRGRYFDGINIGGACAHEYAAHARRGLGRHLPETGRTQGSPGEAEPSPGRRGGNLLRLRATGRPLRAAVGDPWDLRRRPVNLALSILTVRLDRSAGTATFLLHWRDPAKVGHAGGLYQVVPVGVFQPSGEAPWNERNDFDLWRCATREYAEELLGVAEDHDGERAPIDYDGWPFAARLRRAREESRVRVFVLGMGVDPLTFATDLLMVSVFDAPVFDELFGEVVVENDEGRVLSVFGAGNVGAGIAFTATMVDRLVHREPMQAAGAALLALAWRHRETLLA